MDRILERFALDHLLGSDDLTDVLFQLSNGHGLAGLLIDGPLCRLPPVFPFLVFHSSV